MFIKNYKKTKCINGCDLFNDNSKYVYWEKKNETSDEIEIVNYLNKNNNDKKLDILHIGIGNSYVATELKKYNKIDGVTISGSEFNEGRKLNIPNYNIFFQNKYTLNGFERNVLNNYDIIIDVNLKSFTCCEKAFENLFKDYINMLKPEGKIITGQNGMKWSRLVKPVLSFSFKKFFYKRLKEFDGPSSNILNDDECQELSNNFNLKFIKENNSSVVYFKKIT